MEIHPIIDPRIESGTADGQMLFWDGTTWVHTETTELHWNDTTKILTVAAGLTITGNSVFGLNSAVFQPATDSTTFFQVLDADGGTPIFNVDTTNERVGIGVDDPHSKLEVNGAISSATLTIHPSGQTNNTDVSGVNTLFLDLDGANNALISGFTNGVVGQVLHIIIIDHTKSVTLQHVEGLSTQQLYLCDDGDETLTDFGGWVLICDGSNWYDASHAKHA